jgi:hypothetical protein
MKVSEVVVSMESTNPQVVAEVFGIVWDSNFGEGVADKFVTKGFHLG